MNNNSNGNMASYNNDDADDAGHKTHLLCEIDVNK
jgi:hypothetical protein